MPAIGLVTSVSLSSGELEYGVDKLPERLKMLASPEASRAS